MIEPRGSQGVFGHTDKQATPPPQLTAIPGVETPEDRLPIEKLLVQTIRAGMYVLVLALAILHHLFQGEFFSWEIYRNFYAISALGLAVPVLSLPFLNGFFRMRPLVAGSFVLDVLLITALLLTSRLNQSIFLFLFMMTIILSGLVFQTRGALLIALFCSLASTSVLIFGEELKSLGFLFLLLLNNIAFFSVAWISGFLAEQLEVQGLNISDLRKLNQSIVETIPSGLLTVLENGEILQANPGAQGIFGESLHEGVKAQALFPDGALAGFPIQQGRREIRINRGQETQILNLKILPQNIGDKKTYLMVIEDETQVKKLEFAIRQSEKLAAVGQLAAGIAHEIRNPLAGISGSVELLSQNYNSDDDKKLTRIILKEIDRLNNLISEFLDFAKPDKPPTDQVNLSQLLQECLNQVKLTPGYRVDTAYVAELLPGQQILGHADKLKQAFLNMMINSSQAMNASDRPARLTVRLLEEDGRLRVEIQDTGNGMSDEVIKRMFEPFMTTKAKGTGLGLAITHKIFEMHSARIFVESRIGEGTKISVDFPSLGSVEKH